MGDLWGTYKCGIKLWVDTKNPSTVCGNGTGILCGLADSKLNHIGRLISTQFCFGRLSRHDNANFWREVTWILPTADINDR